MWCLTTRISSWCVSGLLFLNLVSISSITWGFPNPSDWPILFFTHQLYQLSGTPPHDQSRHQSPFLRHRTLFVQSQLTQHHPTEESTSTSSPMAHYALSGRLTMWKKTSITLFSDCLDSNEERLVEGCGLNEVQFGSGRLKRRTNKISF